MYATAMMKLHRENGGNAWLKRFFRHLAKCPQVQPTSREKALRQAVNWLVAASLAAGKDLTPVFVGRWRMPLSAADRDVLSKVDWADRGLEPAGLITRLEIARDRSETKRSVRK